MASRQNKPHRIKLKAEIVAWLDPFSMRTSDWMTVEDAEAGAFEDDEANLNYSLGWLIGDYKDRVVLALTKDMMGGRLSDCLVIYKSLIKKRWKL